MSESTDSSSRGYTRLIAWQKAYDLALAAYRATARFPNDERFGLTQQIRRAAVSIACNICEGWGRGSTNDYLRFCYMARGSTNELQTQMWIARDLGYMPGDHPVYHEIDEEQRLINGLIRSLLDKCQSKP